MHTLLRNTLAAAVITASLFAFGCNSAANLDGNENPAVVTASAASAKMSYWTENSLAAADITDYVKSVTDKNSPDFIPEEDRIAVFDLDGTLVGETYPSYFDWVMFTHRVLHDPGYKATPEMKKFARELEDGWKTGKLPKGAEKTHAALSTETFKDLTIEELKDYARKFKETPAAGFNNLKKGDAFFLPMVSLVKYLQANGFAVFIVSGTERNIVRVIIEGVLDVPPHMVLGTDGYLVASHQNSKDGLDYVYQPDDKLIYNGKLITKNVKMNKVPIIAREIGKVPVLAFGNSSGDLSMAQYITNNTKYKSRAYILLGNDAVREHGSEDKVVSLKKYCDEHGFHTISMKDDFATVYGDNVTLAK